MDGSIDDKVKDAPALKHSDGFYFNKELGTGQFFGFLAGIGTALYMGSDVDNSKLGISAITTAVDIGVFSSAYVACAYQDRRKLFSSTWDFAKYMFKATIYLLPAGICHRAAHVSALYGFQHLGIPPVGAYIAAYIPSTAVFFGMANAVGYLTGLVTRKIER